MVVTKGVLAMLSLQGSSEQKAASTNGQWQEEGRQADRTSRKYRK
jgi:hypothetical protein